MRVPALAVAIALLCGAPAHGEVVAREGKGFLERRDDGRLVLHLQGTPYEMGYQHGVLLREQVVANMRRIVHNDGELADAPEYLLYQLASPAMHARLRPHIPARFVEELRGLAAGAGVDYELVEAGNLFPAAFHCSGIALRGEATVDGELYHVRVLDYLTRIGLQEAAVVIVHRPDGLRRWLNVGFAGFIGSVTGMNSAQVAVGEMGGQGLGYWDGVPMAFLIRDALERAGTLAEALEIFRSSPRTCEYYYVISDGKTRDAVGIWATPDHLETIRPGETYAMFEGLRPRGGAGGGKAFAHLGEVVVTDQRVLLRGEGGVAGFVAMQPRDSLILSGHDRYQHFAERLTARFGQVDAPALMEMVKRPVSMGSNLHVAIFRPERLEAWVALAAPDGAPACDQPYARFRLTDEAEPGSSK